MRIPDPKANTTTEAYLAYKAGYLEENELKPVLYEPYLHFDGWLAYWAGLTETYPNKGPGKNQMPQATANMTASGGRQTQFYMSLPAGTYTISFDLDNIEFGTGSSFGIFMGIFGAGGTQIADVSLVSITSSTTPGRKYKTFTISSDGMTDNRDNIRIPATDWDNGARAMLSNIQIEAGSTATEYEPYTIVPEMLTDEEALVAYLSGVTNTYPEEIKDPYDVRIVGYLKYLVSARWGRPDYPVNNEEFYLSTMKPPVVPSGDTPSSDIEMDDTAEAPFIDLKAYGDTSQTTYSGKNLFSIDFSYQSVLPPSETNTFTLDRDTTRYARFDFPVVLPAGTYTISFDISDNNTGSGVFFNLFNQSETSIVLISNIARGVETYHYSGTFTVEESIKIFRCFIAENEVSGSHATLSNVQIETGSTATSFEPYVGGVPSPNPDYPQDIHVVTGRQVVGVRSKNLFYLPNSETRNGVTFTKNPDGTFDLFGVPSDNTNFSIVVDGKLESGEYTLSRDTGNFNLAVQDYSSSGWLSQLLTLNNASKSTSSIDPVGTRTGFVVQAKSGVSYDLKNVQVQLEKGSSDTDFVPYAKENYEINLTGKNLVKFDSQNLAQNAGSSGIVTMSFTDNTITLENTASTSSVVYAYYYTPELNADTTYTLSYTIEKIACLTNNRVVFSYSDDGTTWAANTGDDVALDAGQTYYSTKTFTGHRFYRVGFYNNTSSGGPLGTKTIFKDIQIEEGSTATSFAPYCPPIELCKIGDYQDYIYRDADGDWYVHKEIGKVVFNGTETWGQVNSYAYFSTQISTDIIRPSDIYTKPLILSDYYSPASRSNLYDSVVGYGIGVHENTPSRILIRNKDCTSIPAFTIWLSNHNTTVYYALSTAADTQITNSALIAQLDALMEGGSYEGKTYIKVTATDPNLPGLLYVEAGKYD